MKEYCNTDTKYKTITVDNGVISIDGKTVSLLSLCGNVGTNTYREIYAEVKAAEKNNPETAIEGYAELKKAYMEFDRYHREFSEMTESGKNYKIEPLTVNPEDVEKKYPKAAAYVEAERYSNAANYDKANAGEKAMKRIIAGENFETVIAEMKAEWLAIAEKAVFNN